MMILFCLFIYLFIFFSDLGRLKKTSSGSVRKHTQCAINKVMMGRVSLGRYLGMIPRLGPHPRGIDTRDCKTNM